MNPVTATLVGFLVVALSVVATVVLKRMTRTQDAKAVALNAEFAAWVKS